MPLEAITVPLRTRMPRVLVRGAVRRAVYLSVMGDRRLLGIPEHVRDQIVTWAFHDAMGYERAIRNPAVLVGLDENREVVMDAMDTARDAGVTAYAALDRA